MSERHTNKAIASRVVAIFSAAMACLLAPHTGLGNEPDPTRPPTLDLSSVTPADEEQQSGFTLSAVLYASGRRVAIINDQRVVQGDEIAGATVEEIGARHVRLSKNRETTELSLAASDIKRRHDDSSDPKPFLGPKPASLDARGETERLMPNRMPESERVDTRERSATQIGSEPTPPSGTQEGMIQ